MADEEDEQLEAPAEWPSWPGAQPKQAAFLTALVINGGQRNKAARAAKIARSTHYRWMELDTQYQALYGKAMVQATEVLEDEAIRRAKEGTSKPIFYQGMKVGSETVYSDGLIMFLLRGAAPEKYRERAEVKGEVSVRHKFDGTMEELLATYRKLTREGPEE